METEFTTTPPRQKDVVRILENLRTFYKYAQFSQNGKKKIKNNIVRERGNEAGKYFSIEKGKKRKRKEN